MIDINFHNEFFEPGTGRIPVSVRSEVPLSKNDVLDLHRIYNNYARIRKLSASGSGFQIVNTQFGSVRIVTVGSGACAKDYIYVSAAEETVIEKLCSNFAYVEYHKPVHGLVKGKTITLANGVVKQYFGNILGYECFLVKGDREVLRGNCYLLLSGQYARMCGHASVGYTSYIYTDKNSRKYIVNVDANVSNTLVTLTVTIKRKLKNGEHTILTAVTLTPEFNSSEFMPWCDNRIHMKGVTYSGNKALFYIGSFSRYFMIRIDKIQNAFDVRCVILDKRRYSATHHRESFSLVGRIDEYSEELLCWNPPGSRFMTYTIKEDFTRNDQYEDSTKRVIDYIMNQNGVINEISVETRTTINETAHREKYIWHEETLSGDSDDSSLTNTSNSTRIKEVIIKAFGKELMLSSQENIPGGIIADAVRGEMQYTEVESTYWQTNDCYYRKNVDYWTINRSDSREYTNYDYYSNCWDGMSVYKNANYAGIFYQDPSDNIVRYVVFTDYGVYHNVLPSDQLAVNPITHELLINKGVPV